MAVMILKLWFPINYKKTNNCNLMLLYKCITQTPSVINSCLFYITLNINKMLFPLKLNKYKM